MKRAEKLLERLKDKPSRQSTTLYLDRELLDWLSNYTGESASRSIEALIRDLKEEVEKGDVA